MTCQDYLSDPEANAAHLESCDECRLMIAELDAAIGVRHRPLAVDALPLAPWEGASHRPWPLVAAGAVSVLLLATVLFLASGISPLRGIVRAFASSIPSLDLMVNLSQLAGGALHNAPAAWHIAVGLSFIVINTILFLLLRRAPKGIDV